LLFSSPNQAGVGDPVAGAPKGWSAGHDAWVDGDETFSGVEFESLGTRAPEGVKTPFQRRIGVLAPFTMSQPFEIAVEEHEEFVLVGLVGEVDMAAFGAVESTLLPLEKRFPSVIIDLRGVSFLDSMGLRAIISADARAREEDFALKIVRGPEQVQKLLYLTGLDKILPLIDASELPDAD
jgi:anti-sigma B factor antagonist